LEILGEVYLSIDWPAILPTLCSHYDHVIAISTVGEDEQSEFDDPEVVSYWRKREEMIAGYCDAVVKIRCSDFPMAKMVWSSMSRR
jgi:hypothetical protein